jgi:hypothetical protein
MEIKRELMTSSILISRVLINIRLISLKLLIKVRLPLFLVTILRERSGGVFLLNHGTSLKVLNFIFSVIFSVFFWLFGH